MTLNLVLKSLVARTATYQPCTISDVWETPDMIQKFKAISAFLSWLIYPIFSPYSCNFKSPEDFVHVSAQFYKLIYDPIFL